MAGFHEKPDCPAIAPDGTVFLWPNFRIEIVEHTNPLFQCDGGCVLFGEFNHTKRRRENSIASPSRSRYSSLSRWAGIKCFNWSAANTPSPGQERLRNLRDQYLPTKQDCCRSGPTPILTDNQSPVVIMPGDRTADAKPRSDGRGANVIFCNSLMASIPQ